MRRVLAQPPRALARAAISCSVAVATGVALFFGSRFSWWRLAALTAWEAGGLYPDKGGGRGPGRTAVHALVLSSSISCSASPLISALGRLRPSASNTG